jgi:hypothetical protein
MVPVCLGECSCPGAALTSTDTSRALQRSVVVRAAEESTGSEEVDKMVKDLQDKVRHAARCAQ